MSAAVPEQPQPTRSRAAAREAAGLPVTAPGVPPGHPDPARLVTDDCIRAD